MFKKGSTPLGVYKKLCEYYKNGEISFKYVKTFNMDEYIGFPRNHPESYLSFMFNNLFKYIDIDPNNVHILDGNAIDLNKEWKILNERLKKLVVLSYSLEVTFFIFNFLNQFPILII